MALWVADLDWIVGPGYSWGRYILGCSQQLALCLRHSPRIGPDLLCHPSSVTQGRSQLTGSDDFSSLTVDPNWPFTFRCLDAIIVFFENVDWTHQRFIHLQNVIYTESIFLAWGLWYPAKNFSFINNNCMLYLTKSEFCNWKSKIVTVVSDRSE